MTGKQCVTCGGCPECDHEITRLQGEVKRYRDTLETIMSLTGQGNWAYRLCSQSLTTEQTDD